MGRVNVVGAGIFGVTAAAVLQERGWEVHLFDPGPVPHPDAASTDISKAVRLDYGRDHFYVELMETALEGWHAWDEVWSRPLFHECGVLMLSRTPMRPGDYVHDSFETLIARGHRLERIYSEDLRQRFPAWNADRYADGYFNPCGGWVESGAVVTALLDSFTAAGGSLHVGVRFRRWTEARGGVIGFEATDGTSFSGDELVLAAGAWTAALHPALDGFMWPTAQDVLHVRGGPVERFRPPLFPVYTADVAATGWYGFPALADGTLKVARHGAGRRLDPGDPRHVDGASEARVREFFRDTFPDLVDAPKVAERVCFYTDTFDGDFLIARDPERSGLSLATGGSGHAFKFAPVLGAITADVVEGAPNPYQARFAWREPGVRGAEAARLADPPD